MFELHERKRCIVLRLFKVKSMHIFSSGFWTRTLHNYSKLECKMYWKIKPCSSFVFSQFMAWISEGNLAESWGHLWLPSGFLLKRLLCKSLQWQKAGEKTKDFCAQVGKHLFLPRSSYPPSLTFACLGLANESGRKDLKSSKSFLLESFDEFWKVAGFSSHLNSRQFSCMIVEWGSPRVLI